jgi:hypothetical protein
MSRADYRPGLWLSIAGYILLDRRNLGDLDILCSCSTMTRCCEVLIGNENITFETGNTK